MPEVGRKVATSRPDLTSLPYEPVETPLSVPERLAARLRRRREDRGMSVRALAREVGVSPSLISQIETGKANPSVGTLFAIVSTLNLSLDEIFVDAGPAPRPDTPGDAQDIRRVPPPDAYVMRAADRPGITLASGVHWDRLTPTAEPGIEFMYVTYEVGGASCSPDALMRHNGREFGLVLSGRLGATVGFDTFELGPGDSLVLSCMNPHRFWTISDEPTTAVWAVLEDRAGVADRGEHHG